MRLVTDFRERKFTTRTFPVTASAFGGRRRRNPLCVSVLPASWTAGRGGEIRTHDHLHPMQVRYQAALRPEKRVRL